MSYVRRPRSVLLFGFVLFVCHVVRHDLLKVRFWIQECGVQDYRVREAALSSFILKKLCARRSAARYHI